MLESPGFLRSGGTLAFGLIGLYHITCKSKLEEMVCDLKDEGARVFRLYKGLGLENDLGGPDKK